MGRADVLEVRERAEAPAFRHGAVGIMDLVSATPPPVRAGAFVEGGRLVFRPLTEPERAIDMTERFVAALAYGLWERLGGQDAVNWLEAEILVRNLIMKLERARAPNGVRAAESRFGHLPPQSPPRPHVDPPDGLDGREPPHRVSRAPAAPARGGDP